ncbi:hypothetical protein BN970_00380 [Mycolicibacterium conceptionense]|uniref:Uncharacterized protein n=1 Tax=Mycolicibacterium conceptionense TaxID=451644 RepID=A0A0U1CW95_9MYCO|nr:hypothetical protein BN970_00380 [Mycolicibacterium conceptionense]
MFPGPLDHGLGQRSAVTGAVCGQHHSDDGIGWLGWVRWHDHQNPVPAGRLDGPGARIATPGGYPSAVRQALRRFGSVSGPRSGGIRQQVQDLGFGQADVCTRRRHRDLAEADRVEATSPAGRTSTATPSTAAATADPAPATAAIDFQRRVGAAGGGCARSTSDSRALTLGPEPGERTENPRPVPVDHGAPDPGRPGCCAPRGRPPGRCARAGEPPRRWRRRATRPAGQPAGQQESSRPTALGACCRSSDSKYWSSRASLCLARAQRLFTVPSATPSNLAVSATE